MAKAYLRFGNSWFATSNTVDDPTPQTSCPHATRVVFSGSIPPELGGLPFLEVLDLQSNQLSGEGCLEKSRQLVCFDACRLSRGCPLRWAWLAFNLILSGAQRAAPGAEGCVHSRLLYREGITFSHFFSVAAALSVGLANILADWQCRRCRASAFNFSETKMQVGRRSVHKMLPAESYATTSHFFCTVGLVSNK